MHSTMAPSRVSIAPLSCICYLHWSAVLNALPRTAAAKQSHNATADGYMISAQTQDSCAHCKCTEQHCWQHVFQASLLSFTMQFCRVARRQGSDSLAFQPSENSQVCSDQYLPKATPILPLLPTRFPGGHALSQRSSCASTS